MTIIAEIIMKTADAGAIIAGVAMVVGTIANQLIQAERERKASNKQWEREQQAAQQQVDWNRQRWEETNMAAQREQIEKAGLSVGMMYGNGGTNAPVNMSAKATAPKQETSRMPIETAMGMGLQSQLQKAQIKNIDANTAKTEVETEKIGGADTAKITAETENVIQKTKNEQINEKILQYERALKAIETNKEEMNQWESIDQMRTETKKMNAELQSAVAKGIIDEQTAEATIGQIRTNTIEQQLRIETQKAGLLKTAQEIESSKAGIQKITAEIEKIAADIRKGRNELQLERQKVINDILRTDFQTSDPSQIKQWTQIIMEAAQTGAQIGIAAKLLKK